MSRVNAKKIRILLVDGHSVFREGLAARLNKEKNFAAVAERADSDSMEELIRRHNPVVLVYDIREDAMQEFRAMKEIKEKFNAAISVIAFSDIRSEAAVRDFIRLGGSGYLLKTCPVEECIKAIREAVHGKKFFSQELMEEIFSGKSVLKYDPEGQKIYDGYTPPRKNLLRVFMIKDSIKEIAWCLGLEESAVEYHLKCTRPDFNAHSNKELFRKMLSLDLGLGNPEAMEKG